MPAPPYPLQPEPLKKSWLEHNPYWKIPLGCLTLVVLLVLFAGVLLTVITTSFRNSDVYRQAMAAAAQNSQVREKIGQPLKSSWFLSGQLNVSGSTGNADLLIPISGPNGTGSIRAVANKSGGLWRFTCLQVSVVGQTGIIDLLPVQPPAGKDF
jgi:Cytochrome oxidase complex assembly protein 1